MDNIFYVFNTVLRFANTMLHFPPFHFSILQFSLAIALGGIIVNFIREIFF